MFQELAGHLWEPMGRTSWYPSTVLASGAVVAGWGWFLLQGVHDPLGGINTLWPLFGISNQLLAAIALAVGTTVLMRSGKARYAWVTLLPLAWLLVVTLTAGWQKIFAADPRLGFLAHAAATSARIASGAVDPATGGRLIFNDRLNVAVAAMFMAVVVLVVISSARVWLGILRGTTPATTQEAPYVATSYAN
jgi:carbon starvation protein